MIKRGETYEDIKRRNALRAARLSETARDIGKDYNPKPGNPARRKAASQSFRVFCESYFPDQFCLKWSDDHLMVIDKIDRAVLHGELFALAMPRGSGKTSLCQTAVIWSIFYGHHAFVMLIGSDEFSASNSLTSVKIECETNDELYADFPEILHPIRKLERINVRSTGQTLNGEPTYLEWSQKQIIFPTVKDSLASGAIVRGSGLTGHFRGMNAKRPKDGAVLRPSLVIVDDPQTDESSRSPSQSATRTAVLSGAVLGLAGPGKRIAGIMPLTVINAGDMADMILNRELHPDWQGERTRMVYQFPANMDLWEQYDVVRQDALKAGGDHGKSANEFYAKHREEMDLGAKVAWPERVAPGELSALQHAMNLRFRDANAFFAEYQNEEDIYEKLNGLERRAVPITAHTLTAFVDVQGTVLYYLVLAVEDFFTASIVDYGTYPDQKSEHFVLKKIKHTLQRKFPGRSKEESLYAGLSALVPPLCEREWLRPDGANLKISRLLVDSGWSQETVDRFVRESRLGVVMPSKGIYVGAGNIPWSIVDRKRGEKMGEGWKIPLVRKKRAIRHIAYDTNYWKSFMRSRWKVGLGGRGHLSLWGREKQRHMMLVTHLLSEASTRTEGHGRQVDEWTARGGAYDNHLLDCLVGALVGASEQGIRLMDPQVAKPTRRQQKMKLSELRAAKMQEMAG
jgi:hypothetical protein